MPTGSSDVGNPLIEALLSDDLMAILTVKADQERGPAGEDPQPALDSGSGSREGIPG